MQVEKAVNERKQIVFTGHSSGGPVAIFATLWLLDKYIRPDTSSTRIPPRCLTFGSPLAGNRILAHALKRQNWARYFTHFVQRYDIVPRIMLSPLSSITQELGPILSCFNPKSPLFNHPSILQSNEAIAFFMAVMRNASSVASRVACDLMGSTNSLLETISSFVKLSPYTPFGTYIFCTGNGKLVVVKNPNAVLQTLIYSSQLCSEAQVADAAHRCLYEHTAYEHELKESLEMQNVVYLNNLKDIPLSSNGSQSGEAATINTALNDLGLSTRARICLRAAEELEKQKLRNQAKIDSNTKTIDNALIVIRDYQRRCKDRKVGYYDAFKIQKDKHDFNANVKRLELAGIWDEIIEMLKRYELPDEFENRKEWIELGTQFRRLVEPLDIANYYRHSKNEDTGTYLRDGGRPKRYKYTQRWREHAELMKEGTSSESIFWAKVEEMRRKSFDESKDGILTLEREVLEWVGKGVVGMDVFLESSTFVKWWTTLPEKHRLGSCLKGHMSSFVPNNGHFNG